MALVFFSDLTGHDAAAFQFRQERPGRVTAVRDERYGPHRVPVPHAAGHRQGLLPLGMAVGLGDRDIHT